MGSRARGSRLPRLTGILVVLALAAGGAVYLVSKHQSGQHTPAPLPTKVVSEQQVGLVAQATGPGSNGQLLQLTGPVGGPEFSPVPAAEVQSGTGQWTANLMADDTYIFVFVPTGNCLTAVGTTVQPELTLRRCSLQANQRWQRTGPAVVTQGHQFFQYASLSSHSCLTETGVLPGPVFGAGVSACLSSAATSQLIAFWWASS
ncbi:MAG: hypothetical protein J2P27_16095 [Actinobacteria bacterium]|nr:hypothetical protein [Actinomycetota bacterium]